MNMLLVHLFYLPIRKKMTVKTAIVVNMWKHFAAIVSVSRSRNVQLELKLVKNCMNLADSGGF